MNAVQRFDKAQTPLQFISESIATTFDQRMLFKETPSFQSKEMNVLGKIEIILNNFINAFNSYQVIAKKTKIGLEEHCLKIKTTLNSTFCAQQIYIISMLCRALLQNEYFQMMGKQNHMKLEIKATLMACNEFDDVPEKLKCKTSMEVLIHCVLKGVKMDSLSISKAELTSYHISTICLFCPNIETLSLTSIKFGEFESSVSHLEKLKKLKKLQLASPLAVQSSSLSHLVNIQSLRSLNLSSCVFEESAIKQLGGFKQLQSLNLSNCKKLSGGKYKELSDEDVSPFKNLHKLLSINLSSCLDITEKGLNQLPKTLRVMTLTHCASINGDALASLKTFPALHDVVLGGRQRIKNGFFHLETVQNLKNLYYFSNEELNDNVLDQLIKMENLTSIVLIADQPSFDKTLSQLTSLNQSKKITVLRTCGQFIEQFLDI